MRRRDLSMLNCCSQRGVVILEHVRYSRVYRAQYIAKCWLVGRPDLLEELYPCMPGRRHVHTHTQCRRAGSQLQRGSRRADCYTTTRLGGIHTQSINSDIGPKGVRPQKCKILIKSYNIINNKGRPQKRKISI